MRYVLFCSLAAAMILGACSTNTEPTAASDVEPTAKGTSTVQSTSVDAEWTSYSTTVRNPCTGGFVRFTGKTKITRMLSERGNGDVRYRYRLQVRAQGTDAAGNHYTLIGTRVDEYFEADGGCPWVYEEELTYRVSTAGGGNNFLIKTLFRVTVDCEGNETVDIIDNGGECL